MDLCAHPPTRNARWAARQCECAGRFSLAGVYWRMVRDSQIRSAVQDWLTRILTEAGAASAGQLALDLTPEVERALRAAALDMLRQCSVAQFGASDDQEALQEWDVSALEAVMGALRRLEHRRLADG